MKLRDKLIGWILFIGAVSPMFESEWPWLRWVCFFLQLGAFFILINILLKEENDNS